jgi:hypothetical protein
LLSEAFAAQLTLVPDTVAPLVGEVIDTVGAACAAKGTAKSEQIAQATDAFVDCMEPTLPFSWERTSREGGSRTHATGCPTRVINGLATKRRAERYIHVAAPRQAGQVKISSRCFRTGSTVVCGRLYAREPQTFEESPLRLRCVGALPTNVSTPCYVEKISSFCVAPSDGQARIA